MASPIRRLDLVPPAPTVEAVELAARLARVEAEAAALRDELAALREDVAALSGLEDEEAEPAAAAGDVFSRGWLATGWARASLVLASLGLVMVVSVPYLMHLLGPADADPLPVVAQLAAPSPAPAESPGAEVVAPARLGRTATPKVRAAVSRSRARVRGTTPAPAPAPAPGESR